jgi:hypothetical protein
MLLLYLSPFIPVDTYRYCTVVVRDKSGKTSCCLTFQVYIVG